YYTALTLAVFADLGYYRANWSMAELMSWGKNVGCEFLQKKCVDIKNLATRYPHMFCNKEDKATFRCSSDRRHVGTCTGHIVESKGSLYYKDVCPVISTSFYDILTGETPNTCTGATAETLPGSLTGTGSWCLDAEALQVKGGDGGKKIAGACAQVLCEGGTVKVKYLGAKEPVPCPEGKEVTVVANDHLKGGKLKCPKYAEVCTIAANGSSLVIPRVEEGANGDAEEKQKEDAAEHKKKEKEEAEDTPSLESQPAELSSGAAGGDLSNPKAAAEVGPGTLPAAETQETENGPGGPAHSAAASPPPADAAPSPDEAVAAKESDAEEAAEEAAGAASAAPDVPAPPTPTPTASVNGSAVQKKLDGAAQQLGGDAGAAAAAVGCSHFVLLAVAAAAAVAMLPS
ncbi:surface protease GP63, partial [Trypanosoma conorhini]